MKTIKQIERKMKSLGKLANEFHEDLKQTSPAELNYITYAEFIIQIRNQMELLSWLSGISYKKYLDKEIR